MIFFFLIMSATKPLYLFWGRRNFIGDHRTGNYCNCVSDHRLIYAKTQQFMNPKAYNYSILPFFYSSHMAYCGQQQQ
ncbi:hypothetical protein MtrunA17_Chr3g0140881 [Medicago truncatula]|uniref:Uncharacterized protein n=1 Tax=Medicago truncatula TaxID=3880 RepID=A0A396J6Q0_MEDTR|nr:hypothetical protein MtrunA17_Chr3g0140881 [Medicago truncatula]